MEFFFDGVSDFHCEEGFSVDETPVRCGLAAEFIKKIKAGHGDALDLNVVWEFWVLIVAAVVWSEESNIVSFEGFYEVVGVESCSCERIGWEFERK